MSGRHMYEFCKHVHALSFRLECDVVMRSGGYVVQCVRDTRSSKNNFGMYFANLNSPP